MKVTGEGLVAVPVFQPANFFIDSRSSEAADASVEILSPDGSKVPARVSGNNYSGYKVEYTPVQVGLHTAKVEYADSPAKGSPFTVKVYDTRSVGFECPENSLVGEEVVAQGKHFFKNNNSNQ